MGVQLILGQTVEEAVYEDGRISARFSNGATQEFDQVIVAHGMLPNLSFVPYGTLDADEGLLVDKFMRTSNPDVYAAGDVAQAFEPSFGGYKIVGLWKDACLQGECAGKVIATEMMGAEVPEEYAYKGMYPFNSIAVNNTVLITGGSIDLGASPNRKLVVKEFGFGTVAYVYEMPEAQIGDDGSGCGRSESCGKLVGFNVFTDNGEPSSPAYDEGRLLMRRITGEVE